MKGRNQPCFWYWILLLILCFDLVFVLCLSLPLPSPIQSKRVQSRIRAFHDVAEAMFAFYQTLSSVQAKSRKSEEDKKKETTKHTPSTHPPTALDLVALGTRSRVAFFLSSFEARPFPFPLLVLLCGCVSVLNFYIFF